MVYTLEEDPSSFKEVLSSFDVDLQREDSVECNST